MWKEMSRKAGELSSIENAVIVVISDLLTVCLANSKSTERPRWPSVDAKSYAAGVVWTLGERVPAQVPFSLSKRGSKLRRLSRYSPHVASKQDVNIAELILDNIFRLCQADWII
ncbi:hypothetical protein AVEN_199540-1 [Araneus ventricosus]|uniref:Uncharacterized protein n=1 Tax=Araneus ventricosus TaxID=182803 RepID=A0A4Y2N5M6_ARAVE|nr:hypothetical protein AVEN_199540-1 [Araneus ventricosus]